MIRIRNPVYGPKDPDLHQNVTDSEHCLSLTLTCFTHTVCVPTTHFPDSALTHLCFRSGDLEVGRLNNATLAMCYSDF
jgi:hypothetical protein